MPYIKNIERGKFNEGLSVLKPDLTGELNYLITCLCRDFLYREGERYETYDRIIGALECAKLEFYRMRVAPYEDQKIKENGAV
jgi:hypothetical protein